MPSSDKKMIKKRKLRQKQKQKQVVRTNVKVNVQSSGGSGGGGSSQGGGVPSYIPSAFNEQKLASLVEQIAAKVPVRQQVPVPVGMPIQQQVPSESFKPANDNATLKGVFNSPINFDEPVKVGGVSKGDENTRLEEIATRYRIAPIDVTSDQPVPQGHPQQEYIIQPKKGGRRKGSKNKPKAPVGGGAEEYMYVRTGEEE